MGKKRRKNTDLTTEPDAKREPTREPSGAPSATAAAAAKPIAAPPREAVNEAPPPCSCCGVARNDTAEADDEWDFTTGAARPHYLFKMSGFVMIVAGIFFAFGGWYVARQIPMLPDPKILRQYTDLIQGSLIYATLLIISGILLKLYAIILVLNFRDQEHDIPPLQCEWFLKTSALLFTLTAGAVLIRGYLETHMVQFATASEFDVVAWYAGMYQRRCLMSGTFFLLLGAFTLLYLVNLKTSRGTPFEEVE